MSERTRLRGLTALFITILLMTVYSLYYGIHKERTNFAINSQINNIIVLNELIDNHIENGNFKKGGQQSCNKIELLTKKWDEFQTQTSDSSFFRYDISPKIFEMKRLITAKKELVSKYKKEEQSLHESLNKLSDSESELIETRILTSSQTIAELNDIVQSTYYHESSQTKLIAKISKLIETIRKSNIDEKHKSETLERLYNVSQGYTKIITTKSELHDLKISEKLSNIESMFVEEVEKERTIWRVINSLIAFITLNMLIGFVITFFRTYNDKEKILKLQRENEAKNEKLIIAKDKAVMAERAKSEFLATMSHEIRTPLNGVLGMASILSSTELNQEQQDHLKTIDSCGRALLSLLNDILDLSKIEAGHMHIENHVVNIKELFDKSLKIFSQQAQEKNINLELQIDSDVPAFISADSTRLGQILLNLLGNAVKFTSSGTVSLSLKIESNQNDELLLQACVSDSGIGISDDKLDRLFKPFSQVDSSTTRQYGGTGLGLVICTKLVELMGGRIWVESEVSKGSKFFFSWQTKIVHKEENELAQTSVVDKNIQILVAEDNPVNQKVVEIHLKKLGLSTKIVDDGAKCVEEVTRNNYDVIFMDIQMPNMDGLKATKTIRSLALEKQPFIIALTANAFKEDIDACMEAGMNEFLAKPFNIDGLKRVLNKSIA